MSDAAPPTPFPTPPSISEAVQAELDVLHNVREMRRQVHALEANQQRLANEQTIDRLTLGRVEKKLDLLLKHLGVRDA